MTGSRQQKPRIGLTKCPDLVDHYKRQPGDATMSKGLIFWLDATSFGIGEDCHQVTSLRVEYAIQYATKHTQW